MLLATAYARHVRAAVLLFALTACGKIASTDDVSAPGPRYHGAITAANNDTCGVEVAFWDEEPADDARSDCSLPGETRYGACCYIDALYHGGPAGDFPLNASAGAVSLALPTGPARLEPNDDKSYPRQPDVPCNQAGTLSVSAAGDEVHAFVGLLPIVTPLTPALSDTTQTVDRDHDFVLHWTRDSRPNMTAVIRLEGTARPDGLPSATCQVADVVGALTLPAALLKNFPAGKTWVETFRLTTTVTTDNAEIALTGTASTAVYVELR
jgi:hypothetical protein